MTEEQYRAEIARMSAENAQLKARNSRGLSFKVGQKGGVSVYIPGKQHPVTLYKEQWEALFPQGPSIRQFGKDNKAELDRKYAATHPSK